MAVMPPVVCPSCCFSKPMAKTTSCRPEATRLSAAAKTVAPVVPPWKREGTACPRPHSPAPATYRAGGCPRTFPCCPSRPRRRRQAEGRRPRARLHRLVNQLGLVDVLAVAGVARLAHSDDRNRTILFWHDRVNPFELATSSCFQGDDAMLLAGRAGGSMRERAAGPGDLPALRFAPQLQGRLRRAGQAANDLRRAGQGAA